MKRLSLVFAVILAAGLFVSCAKEESNPMNGAVPHEVYKGIVLEDQSLTSQYMKGGKALYNIYLPSDWQTSGKKYPVLYLLHGMWSNNREWTQNGAVNATSDMAIRDGYLGQFIVVMPNVYDSFYVDGYDKENNTESFFWKELKPYIESHYPVLTGRENTAIAGLSMGGFGASYYAFKYPDQFCFCYEMSGAVGGMGTDLVPSVQRMFEMWGYTKDRYEELPYYIMDCGDNDDMCGSANVWIHWWLDSVEFPHVYRHRAGAHEWSYWTECYKNLVKDIVPFFKNAPKFESK